MEDVTQLSFPDLGSGYTVVFHRLFVLFFVFLVTYFVLRFTVCGATLLLSQCIDSFSNSKSEAKREKKLCRRVVRRLRGIVHRPP